MQSTESDGTGAEGPGTPGLQRALGLWQLSLAGTGIILGAGIYALLAPAAALAGNAVWASFLIAAAVAVVSGLSYAELSSMFPTAGAEYDYAGRALGEGIGVAIGWLVIAATLISASAVALGFAAYFRTFLPLPPVAVAVVLIGILSLLVALGVRETAGAAVLLTLVEVGGLVTVIVAGLPRVGGVDLLELSPAGTGGLLEAAALVFFAFIGFEQLVKLSEEAKDPGRTIPLALLISVAGSTLLYMLVAVACISLLGWEGTSATDAPFAAAIGVAFGGAAAVLVSLTALTATANTVLIEILAASRILYGMARSGAAPRVLGRVHARRRTPWIAVVVIAAVSAVLTVPGEIEFLASATNFLIFVTFIAVNLSVVLLRRAEPEARRPFRVPVAIRGVPVLPLVGIATSLGLMSQLDPAVLLAGLAISGVAVVMAVQGGRRRRRDR
ncbi:MAG: amino acid permease [Methanospirillum sp.]|nr:amino acid permease [Methanospirillum sp.]